MTGLHPDVALAIQHREQMERREAMRERTGEFAPDPTIALREAIADLATIVSELCADQVRESVAEEWRREPGEARLEARGRTEHPRELHERAAALKERLS